MEYKEKLDDFQGKDDTIGKGVNIENDTNGERVCSILKKSNIKFEYTSKNYEEIWSKYMFIASYGLVTAHFNKTLGEVYENSELSKNVLSIMNTIKALADKVKINLPENIVKISYDKAKSFPYETKTSFQRDYEKETGRDERELFGKAIIDMAQEYNIDCTCVQDIYERLK